MLFLIDEDVPIAVGEYLRQRGHDVRFVQDEFGKGTPDTVIAAGGDLIGAVIITFNRRHFERLVQRVPEGGRQRFRNLGRICFSCRQSRARQRIEDTIEFIEFQHERTQRRPDRRLIMDSSDTTINIVD